MEFDFSSEQKLLKEQARRYLAEKASMKSVRAVLNGPQSFDRELWSGLVDMGFTGISIPEALGGSGLGYLELCVVAEEVGRVLAPVPFSSSIYLAAEFLMMAGNEEQKHRLLPEIVSGRGIGCLALTEGIGGASVDARVEGGRLSGTKIAVPDGDVATFAVVAARSVGAGNALSLFLVDLGAEGIERVAVDAIDPTRSHAQIAFDRAPAEPLGQPGDGRRLLDAVFDRAAVLLAFEQLGGADRALEMARDYAQERMAFGRPIGSFQAVKHMLADMYVSATLARSNCYFGAWALSTAAAELPEAAATARLSATHAFQHCARNNIQVHGGIGFTWEADCHLFYRRSNLLALTLGSRPVWESRLVDQLCLRNAA